MKKTHLLIIDAQNDFCDKSGALYVTGADDDMKRLALFIDKYKSSLGGITVTFDLHKSFHIASPVFWVDKSGVHPAPFTIITKDDVLNGKYRASVAEYQGIAENYVSKLEENGRYQLCIWPPHCITGSYGADIYKPLYDAIEEYNKANYNKVEYILKNMNSFTEQYSILRADVEIENESSEKTIFYLTQVINDNDVIFVAGEALSHCVANSVLDIATYITKDLSKFVLLIDASSCVSGFENLGEEFLNKAKSYGMKVSTILESGVFLNEQL